MPPPQPSSSARHKRVHQSPSTPLLRPSPLSQVLLAPDNPDADDEGGEDDGGRTPTALRPPQRLHGQSSGHMGEHASHGRSSHHRPHPHPRTSSGPAVSTQQQQQPKPAQARRPQTARSYFQQSQSQSQLSSPVSPLSPAYGMNSYPLAGYSSPFSSPFGPYGGMSEGLGAPSQADYLNGGVGWNVMPSFPPSHSRRNRTPTATVPAPKTRGRSHTITAANLSTSPTSSSSPSTSPETSVGPGSPPSEGVLRESSWGKHRVAPSIMHWTRPTILSELKPTRGVRGGTATIVDGSSIWFFGGYDGKGAVDDVWALDTECMEWWKVDIRGPGGPPPLRAHSAVCDGRNIFVFGGGSGDEFFNDLWMLDTVEQVWYLLPCTAGPTPRRAHVSFIHDDMLYIYGGGSGTNALSDLWRVDISLPSLMRIKDEPLQWEEVQTFGQTPDKVIIEDEGNEEGKPAGRGYMSATLVGDVLVVLGGQSGQTGRGEGEHDGPWGDCWLLYLGDMHWEEKRLNPPFPLASHTATLVGMSLFVFGGNDGKRYNNDLRMLNLITMQWEPPKIRGRPPPERAQHQALLLDSRLWIFGGFDGKRYFEEPAVLDLAGSSWLAGVTEFEVGGDAEGWD